MAWERFLRVCRAIFFLSVAALSAGFVLVLVIIFGDAAWLGSPSAIDTVAASFMAFGAIGGGMSALVIRFSRG